MADSAICHHNWL